MFDYMLDMIVRREHQTARDHLDRLLLDWRKQLWPDKSKDPLWLEEHAAHVARIKAAMSPEVFYFAERYGVFRLIP